ncbi:GNAT family N-acetyltransferase [Thalassovita aquimarina]|uniref:GNAT family N-acetyltransferase n=1 Tax=Thalassovita aquimarina TaxID=2785917 RepID=A0ABS5HKW8_9RHOB|nr:GNAT family N-acetyltransferase [Thalassovita aquimarina]
MAAWKIRPLSPKDEPGWRALWQGYNAFYERAVEERVTARLWDRIVSETGEPFALVAEIDGDLVGMAHYFFLPSTSDWGPRCYMQDLFAAPQARGQGIGRALIETIQSDADRAGAAQVYWLTDKSNTTARKLYDRVAKETPFIKYRMQFAGRHKVCWRRAGAGISAPAQPAPMDKSKSDATLLSSAREDRHGAV